MLGLAIVADQKLVEQLASEIDVSNVFRVIIKDSVKGEARDVVRLCQTHRPDIILLDVEKWTSVNKLAALLNETKLRSIVVAFKHTFNRAEQLTLQDEGIRDFLIAPFSLEELEAKAAQALSRDRPLTHPNTIAFIPAKAGSGASMVALHTASALSLNANRSVVLLEADRRSGMFSTLLKFPTTAGIAGALGEAHNLTTLGWNQCYVEVGALHVSPANPTHRDRMPSWADYRQLLEFVESRYDYILADLPEVVNPGTAEIVRSARSVFVVCTPELPSLKLAAIRIGELIGWGVPEDRIQILVNRFQKGAPTLEDMTAMLERPIYATLPNDYRSIKKGMLGGVMADAQSEFYQACIVFAARLTGYVAPEQASKFTFLRKLTG